MSTATFALIFGIAYLGAGLLGLIPATLMPPPADAPPTTFTVLYGYLLGLFPVNMLFGMLPMHGHDVWLHAGTAAVAAYFGWRQESDMERRQMGERRQRMLP